MTSEKQTPPSSPSQGSTSPSSLRGASATKQPEGSWTEGRKSTCSRKCGLLRFARNDGRLADQTVGNDGHNDETVLSNKVEEAARFVPEVDPMGFLPIVNERGNIMGRALYMEMHNGNKMLHPVAHLHVLNTQGETTRRYWWHVAFGDTPEKTLKRKMAEALGLSGVKPMLKRQYIREAKTEKELVYVFTIVSEENLLRTPEGKEYLELFEKD